MLAALAVTASSVVAQIATGGLTGTVIDEAGAAVPGTAVTVTAQATNIARTTVSHEDGTFMFPGLPPGMYRLRAELDGFRSALHESVTVAKRPRSSVPSPATMSSKSA